MFVHLKHLQALPLLVVVLFDLWHGIIDPFDLALIPALELFDPWIECHTGAILAVPQRSLVLLLHVLNLGRELALRRDSLVALALDLLVSPLLFPREDVLELVRVELLRGLIFLMVRVELGLEVVQGNSKLVLVFAEELQVELGLLTLGLENFYLLLKSSILILQILLLQRKVIIVLFKYFELLHLPVIFVPFKRPSLAFLPQAHDLALHDHLLLGEPLQPQVLVHVLRLQILGQLAVLLDLVEELDFLFSFLLKL